jgi:hypothetical protein
MTRKGTTRKAAPDKSPAPPVRQRDARGRFVKAPPPPAKAARERDARGRFVKAPPEVVRTIDSTGQLHTRDARGRFVKMDPDAPRAVGRKDTGRKRVLQPSKGAARKASKPKGYTEALALDLHFNSAPRVAMDNAATGRGTVVKWRGRFYRVRPESAGAAQDAFREIIDDYVKLFLPFMDSPQLRIPMYELPGVDVLDFDKLDTLDEEVTEAMIDDQRAEAAQETFLQRAADVLDPLTSDGESTDETRQADGSTVRRKPTRSAARERGRRRKR